MKFGNIPWALALILTGSIFAVQAQAAVGKSGLGSSQATKRTVTSKAVSFDQNDDSLSDFRPAALTHKFGIRR